MSELTAEDFYNEIKEFVDKPQFTKLTSTGISSDYKSVFEFAEAYYDARIKANESNTSCEQNALLADVRKSFTADFIISELEDCDHLDDAIMRFKEQI
jgi:hypothetical protein